MTEAEELASYHAENDRIVTVLGHRGRISVLESVLRCERSYSVALARRMQDELDSCYRRIASHELLERNQQTLIATMMERLRQHGDELPEMSIPGSVIH